MRCGRVARKVEEEGIWAPWQRGSASPCSLFGGRGWRRAVAVGNSAAANSAFFRMDVFALSHVKPMACSPSSFVSCLLSVCALIASRSLPSGQQEAGLHGSETNNDIS